MINQKELKKILHYDENTGLLVWIILTARRIKVGNIAGSVAKNGYIAIGIKGKAYKAHRLAWLYVYGVLPTEQIDHINHIKTDNRIVNLREVGQQENSKNQSKRKNNTSGANGVYWSKRNNRWRANIRVDGELKHLGLFADFSDAVNARKNAEILYGYHENHGI